MAVNLNSCAPGLMLEQRKRQLRDGFLQRVTILVNRYDIPDGYIAVCHVVSNLVKKGPLRLSSCWTPVSGSFESIVEEDEELNDEEGLETNERTKADKTGTIRNCWYFG